MSFENPLIYENARHFPPRLPTARPLSDPRNRSKATRKIKAWISRRERSSGANKNRQVERTQEDSFAHSDSQSLSVASIVSDDSFDTGVEMLWRKLKEGRCKLEDLKATMIEKRSEMRSLRAMQYAADSAFMGAIRPTLVNRGALRQASMERIDRLFGEVQRLRTEYQYLETSYEELEDDLNREEAQLHRVEVRFFSLLGSGHDTDSMVDSAAPDPALSFNNVPLELRGISQDKSVEDVHPLFVQLTLAVASFRNGQEELNSLLNMKDQCDDAVRVKKRFGQRIPTELSNFLNDFASREASKRKEVFYHEQEVRRLKQLCEDRNVMAKHPSLDMVKALDSDSGVGEDIPLDDPVSILSNRRNLAHARFSELLSQPDHLLSELSPVTPVQALQQAKEMPEDNPERHKKLQLASKEIMIDKLVRNRSKEERTASFVNRWILFTLRNSPLEAVMLFNVFNLRLRVRNVMLWQRDVLRFWDRDGTTAGMDRYRDFDDGSQYYTCVGTPPRTRAASEGADSQKLFRHHRRPRSSGAITSTP
jgi:recombinational DNA repair protein (RecF pathway)